MLRAVDGAMMGKDADMEMEMVGEEEMHRQDVLMRVSMWVDNGEGEDFTHVMTFVVGEHLVVALSPPSETGDFDIDKKHYISKIVNQYDGTPADGTPAISVFFKER